MYKRARRWAIRRIFAAPITMLGKQLFLDPGKFLVENDKIHVLSREQHEMIATVVSATNDCFY